MKKTTFSALSLFALSSILLADGTEMLGAPSIAIDANATDVIVAGTGFSAGQPSSLTVDVAAGTTVLQALLYWEGFANSEAEQGATDTIQIDYNSAGFGDVTGQRIGGPSLFVPSLGLWTTTYRAEVDAALFPVGSNVVDAQGLDFGFVSNGLGVMLVVDNGMDTGLQVQDGNDSAFVNFAAPFDSTMVVEFNYDATDSDRSAALSHFVSSVTSNSSSGPDRPTTIQVGFDAEPFSLFLYDSLGANAGTPPGGSHTWEGDFDVLRHLVTVPANSSKLRIQILSEDSGMGAFAGNLPASLVWLACALSIEEPAPPLGEIGDTVYCDVNDNGTQEADEPGIAGVTVNLRCVGDDGVLDTADDLVDSQVTDGNGNYLFVDLPAGRCIVAVDTTTAGDKVPGMCPLDFDIDLAAGQSYLDADFCFIEPPGGGQGCTPGYWKNRGRRSGQWLLTPYTTEMNFDMVFGTTVFDAADLLDVLKSSRSLDVPHDLYRALGRHGVAALLNATHPDVDYDLSGDDVIMAVSLAFASEDLALIEETKDMLDEFNNQHSPICN